MEWKSARLHKYALIIIAIKFEFIEFSKESEQNVLVIY
jgi:hypothetical protein